VRVYPTKRSSKPPRTEATDGTLALAADLAAAPASRAVLRWNWSIAIEIMSVQKP